MNGVHQRTSLTDDYFYPSTECQTHPECPTMRFIEPVVLFHHKGLKTPVRVVFCEVGPRSTRLRPPDEFSEFVEVSKVNPVEFYALKTLVNCQSEHIREGVHKVMREVCLNLLYRILNCVRNVRPFLRNIDGYSGFTHIAYNIFGVGEGVVFGDDPSRIIHNKSTVKFERFPSVLYPPDLNSIADCV